MLAVPSVQSEWTCRSPRMSATRHQLRQLVRLGERDLAAILAQLRRDEGKPELLVDLLLGGAGDPPLAGKQAVFVELPVALVGEAAQRDVVRLGAGEIQQRRAIALLRHGADIDLQAGAQHDGRARRAMGENLGDVLVTDELVADRRPVRRRHQDIEIADGVAAAAIAAGDHDAAAVAQKADQRLGFGFRDRKLEALLGRRLFQRAGELLFDRRAKAVQLMQPPGLDGAAQIVERAHLELVVEQLDALRPEARKRGHLAKLAGQLASSAGRAASKCPVLTMSAILPARSLPMPGSSERSASVRQQAADALRQAFDGAGRAAIGAHAKLVLALDFQELGGLIEHRRDFGVLDRHRS